MEETSLSPSSTPLNPQAEPFEDTNAAQSPRGFNIPSPDIQVYQHLSTYPFHQDAEFQSGLAAILGHPDEPLPIEELDEKADLVLQAQCFYFARQNNITTPINPKSYKSWLQTQPSYINSVSATAYPTTNSVSSNPPSQPTSLLQPQATSSTNPPLPETTFSHPTLSPSSTSTPPFPFDPPPEPRYPASFDHIVDLITRNQPIPGIENIPDIVLGTEQSAPSTLPKRRKPWEKDAENVTEDERKLSEIPYGGLIGPLDRVENGQTGAAWAETVVRDNNMQEQGHENALQDQAATS